MPLPKEINGLDSDQVKMLRSLVSEAQEKYAEAAGVIAGSGGAPTSAATWAACRRELLSGSRSLAHARAMLDVACEERAWCSLCGDGAPGEIANGLTGLLQPCSLCHPEAQRERVERAQADYENEQAVAEAEAENFHSRYDE